MAGKSQKLIRRAQDCATQQPSEDSDSGAIAHPKASAATGARQKEKPRQRLARAAAERDNDRRSGFYSALLEVRPHPAISRAMTTLRCRGFTNAEIRGILGELDEEIQKLSRKRKLGAPPKTKAALITAMYYFASRDWRNVKEMMFEEYGDDLTEQAFQKRAEAYVRKHWPSLEQDLEKCYQARRRRELGG